MLIPCAGSDKPKCHRMATRLAWFTLKIPQDDGSVFTGDVLAHACDEHGREPSEPIAQADAARAWNKARET